MAVTEWQEGKERFVFCLEEKEADKGKEEWSEEEKRLQIQKSFTNPAHLLSLLYSPHEIILALIMSFALSLFSVTQLYDPCPERY